MRNHIDLPAPAGEDVFPVEPNESRRIPLQGAGALAGFSPWASNAGGESPGKERRNGRRNALRPNSK